MGIVGNGGESRDTRIREEWETTEVEKERTAQDTEKKTKQIQNNLHNIKTYIQRDTYFFLLLARVFFRLLYCDEIQWKWEVTRQGR